MAALTTLETSVVTQSAGETQSLGKAIGRHLHPGDVLCLVGEVGAGKTTLIQGMAQGLGVKEPAQSPTFVLVNEYHGKIPLYHFDFFRLSLQEIESTGWEDYLKGDGAVVVEWADIGRSLWPEEFLEIRIESKEGSENIRTLKFHSQGRRYELLVKRILSRRHATARH